MCAGYAPSAGQVHLLPREVARLVQASQGRKGKGGVLSPWTDAWIPPPRAALPVSSRQEVVKTLHETTLCHEQAASVVPANHLERRVALTHTAPVVTKNGCRRVELSPLDHHLQSIPDQEWPMTQRGVLGRGAQRCQGVRLGLGQASHPV